MEAAHYHRLSQAEWETAEREEFTVSSTSNAREYTECPTNP
jgi:hypothetical protein